MATGNMYNKFVKFGHTVFWDMQADRQTDRHADQNASSAYWGKVTKIATS